MLRDAAPPLGYAVSVLALGWFFSQSAPVPDAAESLERCERLISGSVEAGDRQAAQRWLATCDVPSADGEQLLSERWSDRWGEQSPPRLVGGVV